MIEIKGKFYKSGCGDTGKFVPAAGAYLELEPRNDDPDAEFRVVEEGEEVEYSGEHFLLDRDGWLPRGASVRSIDEILPAGSYYVAEVVNRNSRNQSTYYYKERVEITGTEPVDLTPPPEPEPEAVAPQPPRQMPSPRKLGTNYHGFFAGVSQPPALGICTSPRDGTLPALAFTLTSRSVVSVASIRVLVPRAGKHVLVALYDTDGDRVCSASIPADNAGICTGDLERTMMLNAGEYTLVWLTEVAEIQGIDFGPGRSDQLSLMNAGGGGVVAGTTVERYDCSSGSLPEQIGKIVPNTTWVPPLVYLKS